MIVNCLPLYEPPPEEPEPPEASAAGKTAELSSDTDEPKPTTTAVAANNEAPPHPKERASFSLIKARSVEALDTVAAELELHDQDCADCLSDGENFSRSVPAAPRKWSKMNIAYSKNMKVNVHHSISLSGSDGGGGGSRSGSKENLSEDQAAATAVVATGSPNISTQGGEATVGGSPETSPQQEQASAADVSPPRELATGDTSSSKSSTQQEQATAEISPKSSQQQEQAMAESSPESSPQQEQATAEISPKSSPQQEQATAETSPESSQQQEQATAEISSPQEDQGTAESPPKGASECNEGVEQDPPTDSADRSNTDKEKREENRQEDQKSEERSRDSPRPQDKAASEEIVEKREQALNISEPKTLANGAIPNSPKSPRRLKKKTRSVKSASPIAEADNGSDEESGRGLTVNYLDATTMSTLKRSSGSVSFLGRMELGPAVVQVPRLETSVEAREDVDGEADVPPISKPPLEAETRELLSQQGGPPTAPPPPRGSDDTPNDAHLPLAEPGALPPPHAANRLSSSLLLLNPSPLPVAPPTMDADYTERSGWLNKLSHRRGMFGDKWQKRYFVLHRAWLYYFKKYGVSYDICK